MKTKVIAVHSFKGGTGKTTLTANLASTLALDHRVGVMDLDLSGPGLHVLFGLRKGDIKATLTDIFLGDASPNDVVVDLSRKYGLSKGGLFFCPASNKVEDMLRLLKSGLEVSVFQDILQKVGESKNLDYIKVDTHPGVENDTVLAMGRPLRNRCNGAPCRDIRKANLSSAEHGPSGRQDKRCSQGRPGTS